jgi:SOS-response transcriptional repressor LexA/DNA-binding XRE family transcriptional regulator
MARKPINGVPEWSRKILAFRQALELTQDGLGRKLNTSAMAVSRWERGEVEPTAEAYLRLGSLAGDPHCWYYWGHAGLSTADVMRVLPAARERLRQDRIASVRVVHAGAEGSKPIKSTDFVAIPVLPVHAGSELALGNKVEDLDQLTPEGMWAAPAEWCPNHSATVSMRVKGNSMAPLVLDGYIIAVDTSDVARDDLVGQMVVAWHTEEKWLLTSRMLRFDHTEALVSDQRDHPSILLGPQSKWRIVGKVPWWAGKPSQTKHLGLSPSPSVTT